MLLVAELAAIQDIVQGLAVGKSDMRIMLITGPSTARPDPSGNQHL